MFHDDQTKININENLDFTVEPISTSDSLEKCNLKNSKFLKNSELLQSFKENEYYYDGCHVLNLVPQKDHDYFEKKTKGIDNNFFTLSRFNAFFYKYIGKNTVEKMTRSIDKNVTIPIVKLNREIKLDQKPIFKNNNYKESISHSKSNTNLKLKERYKNLRSFIKDENQIIKDRNLINEPFFILSISDITSIFSEGSIKGCSFVNDVSDIYKCLRINVNTGVYDFTNIGGLFRDSGKTAEIFKKTAPYYEDNFTSASKDIKKEKILTPEKKVYFSESYTKEKPYYSISKSISESTKIDRSKTIDLFTKNRNYFESLCKRNMLRDSESQNHMYKSKNEFEDENFNSSDKNFNSVYNSYSSEYEDIKFYLKEDIINIYREYSYAFYGRNLPRSPPQMQIFSLIFSNFIDPCLLLLFSAGILSLSIGLYKFMYEDDAISWIEGACMLSAVLIIVFINTSIEIYLKMLFNRLNNNKMDNLESNDNYKTPENNINHSYQNLDFELQKNKDKHDNIEYKRNNKVFKKKESLVSMDQYCVDNKNDNNTNKNKINLIHREIVYDDNIKIKTNELDDGKRRNLSGKAKLFSTEGIKIIDSTDIAVGDVIYLRQGDYIPADCIIILEGCYKTCGDYTLKNKNQLISFGYNETKRDENKITGDFEYIENPDKYETNKKLEHSMKFHTQSDSNFTNKNRTVKKNKIEYLIKDDSNMSSDTIKYFNSLDNRSVKNYKMFCTHGEIFTDESMLSGGSTNTPKSHCDPLLYEGTFIVDGEIYALVLAVGKNTHKNITINHINDFKKPISDKKKSPLEKKIEEFTRYITFKSVYLSIILVFAHIVRIFYQYYKNRNFKSNISNLTLETLDPRSGKIDITEKQKFINLHDLSITIVQVISIVVMSVPEGLPMALTLTLAIATTRMLEEKILVKKVNACEIMNSVNIIITDKVGTLTHSEMCARYVYTGINDNSNETIKYVNSANSVVNKDKCYQNEKSILDRIDAKSGIDISIKNPDSNIEKIENRIKEQDSIKYTMKKSSETQMDFLNNKQISNSNNIYNHKGKVRKVKHAKNSRYNNLFELMGEMATLNSLINSSAFESGGSFIGSMNESIFLRIAKSQKIDYNKVRFDNKIVKRISFSSKRGYMSTIIKSGNVYAIFFKGDPEKISNYCNLQMCIKDNNKHNCCSTIKKYNLYGGNDLKNDNFDCNIQELNKMSKYFREKTYLKEISNGMIKKNLDKFDFFETTKNIEAASDSQNFNKKYRKDKNGNKKFFTKKNNIQNDKKLFEYNHSETQPFDKISLLSFTRLCDKKCYRTLCFAYTIVTDLLDDSAILGTHKLTFLCAVGMEDPIRKKMNEKIISCKNEGLKVILVTGDKSNMAEHIAKKVGILTNNYAHYKLSKNENNFQNNIFTANMNNDNYNYLKKFSDPTKNINENNYSFQKNIKNKFNSYSKNEKNIKNAAIDIDKLANKDKKIDQITTEIDENFNSKNNITDQTLIDRKDIVISGYTMKHVSDHEFKKIANRVRVFSRASPSDKLNFVKTLQEIGNVVAITGDGTNDILALKKADVGFALESGTDMAREAASIILLSNDFGCIKRCIEWGKIVNSNIRNYIQFQVTSTISSVFIAGSMSIFLNPSESIFSPLKLLWINIVMDMLVVVAMVTDKPVAKNMIHIESNIENMVLKDTSNTDKKNLEKQNFEKCDEENKKHNQTVKNNKKSSTDLRITTENNNCNASENPRLPFNKSNIGASEKKNKIETELITNNMKIFMIVSVAYQCLLIYFIWYFGYSTTFLFNIFLYLQIFTQINARSTSPHQNSFHGLSRNKIFWISNFIIVLIQFIITNKACIVFKTEALSFDEFVGSVVIAFSIVPFFVCFRYYQRKIYLDKPSDEPMNVVNAIQGMKDFA